MMKSVAREKADLETWWKAAQEKKRAWEKRIEEMEKPKRVSRAKRKR